METSLKEIESWRITPRETERLEFKAARNQYDDHHLYRYCVALANEGGGKLVLGMSDKPPREINGTQAYRNAGAITQKILDKLHFRVDVEEVAHPDGRLVVFHIPSRPLGTAYEFEGAYLMRSGESLVAMPESRLRQIFAEGQPDWCSQIAASGYSEEEVARLLDIGIYFDLCERPTPSTRAATLQALADKKFLVHDAFGWDITNMGAILFAKRLSDWETLAQKMARVVVYEGDTKRHTRTDTATLDDDPLDAGYAVIFKELLTLINTQLPQHEFIEADFRSRTQMVPAIALREIVANALVHQDFTEGGGVRIEIWNDRVEISNSGLPSLPLNRFIDEDKARNESLAVAMRIMKMCENKGSGIDKALLAIEENNLPAVDFRVGTARMSVMLFGPRDVAQMSREERIRACFQHCVLHWICNRYMNNQSLRERFGLPNSNAKIALVSQVISDTVSEGRIKLVEGETNSKRYARYIPVWA